MQEHSYDDNAKRKYKLMKHPKLKHIMFSLIFFSLFLIMYFQLPNKPPKSFDKLHRFSSNVVP